MKTKALILSFCLVLSLMLLPGSQSAWRETLDIGGSVQIAVAEPDIQLDSLQPDLNGAGNLQQFLEGPDDSGNGAADDTNINQNEDTEGQGGSGGEGTDNTSGSGEGGAGQPGSGEGGDGEPVDDEGGVEEGQDDNGNGQDNEQGDNEDEGNKEMELQNSEDIEKPLKSSMSESNNE